MKHSKCSYFVQTSCGLYVQVTRKEFDYVRHDCNMYGNRAVIDKRSFDDDDSLVYYFLSFILE